MKLNDPSIVDPGLFWFWNATPTRREIDEKLDAFLSKGFRSVYIHPMPQSFRPAEFFGGMEVEYLSPAFFELVGYTCEAMVVRKMTLWLYDEGGWPSGMAGGRVVREDPNYGVWMLDKQGDSIQPTQLVKEISYPDLMNPAATDCFIRHTHEKYRACIGHEFGRTVRGIFTDEPRLIGRVGTERIPYSPLLPEAFESDHGYKLNGVLPELFVAIDGDENRAMIQRDYRRTISRLIAENYYQRLHNWCEENQLIFEGHHSGEDDFARHGQYFGNYLQQAKHYHIPGVDTIWRQIFPGNAGGNYVQLASSAAWLRGGRVAVSESFAVYGPGLTLEQMKWIAAFQIVRGVNKIGAMASLHDVRGARRINVGTDLSPKNPVWRDVDLWCEFVRNAARFSMKGQPQASVGVLYRDELVALDKADAFNLAHEAICDRLHDQLVSWLFVGAEDLPIPSLSALLIHVDGLLDRTEINSIIHFASSGAKILWLGDAEPPVELANLPNLHRLAAVEQLNLQEHSAVQTNDDLSGVRLLALREGNWRGYLFFNQNSDAVTFAFQPKDAGELIAHQLEAGLLTSQSDRFMPGGVQITLNAGEMRAFESSRQPCSDAYAAGESSLVLSDGWTVARAQRFEIVDDVETIEGAERAVSVQLGDFALVDRAFSGSLIYENSFELPEVPPDARIVVDLGKVFYSAEVSCNGISAGRRAWLPFWFDVTKCIKRGRNELRIRVTNTLANQWARPDIRARDLAQWKNMYLEKITPFLDESLHSGLVGPVVIRTLRNEA